MNVMARATFLERAIAIQPFSSRTMGLCGACVGTVIGVTIMKDDSDMLCVPASAFVCTTLARAYPVTAMYTPHIGALGVLLFGINYGTIQMIKFYVKEDTV